MDAIKLRTVLSSLLQELSEWESGMRKRIVDKSQKNGVLLFLELKRQIRFLIQFKYSRENIQNHLMHKAANFFGFDFEEKESKKKLKNKPNRLKIRLKYEGGVERKKIFDRLWLKGFGKKGKKIEENFYRPPE